MKYRAFFTVATTCSVEVEADSEEAAEEKAWELVDVPSLCWQCSRQLDVGDILDMVEVEVIE